MEAKVRSLLPELSTSLRKGNCGRLGIVGGSMEYAGAPYFADISALKVGVDIVHVFTSEDAAPVIKCYSPELIVHPELDPGSWSKRLDVMLVGPGLGRDENSMKVAVDTIVEAQRLGRPVVVDSDGLYAFTERWEWLIAAPRHHAGLPIILTPNAVEMDRLAVKLRLVASKLAERLKMNIFIKGPTDMFATPDGMVRLFDREGAPRRPCGLGDCLGGIIAVFLLWSTRRGVDIEKVAMATSFVVREVARRAFVDTGRGMTASDVITHISQLMKSIDDGGKKREEKVE